MINRLGVLVVLCSLCSPAPTRAYAQRVCSPCPIVVDRLLSIGEARDSFSLRAEVARGPTGRFYVAPTDRDGEIRVFNSAGRFSATHTQRLRQDLRRISHIAVSAGDVVYVIDQGARRLTILDSTGRIVRRHALPLGGYRVLAGDSGDAFIQGPGHTEASAGFLAHRLRADGSVFSFAEVPGAYVAGVSNDVRAMARSGDGVWLARVDTAEIVRWNAEGVLDRRLGIDMPARDSGSGAMTRTWVADIFEDRAGRLWIVSASARDVIRPSSFGEAWPTPGIWRDPKDVEPPATTQPNVRTSVDVVDSRRGTLLGRASLAGAPFRFLNDSVAYSRNVSRNVVSFDILRVQVP